MRRMLLAIGLIAACNVCAQNYTRDAGIRIGDFFSITYRMHLDDEQAFEGIASANTRGSNFTIMKEHFRPALSEVSANLFFLYGYGAHVGFRYIDHYRVFNRVYELDGYRFTPLVGIDGMIGLEYRFPDLPFVAGVDFKPYFEFSTVQVFNLYMNSFGLSFKYRF